jgi:hypothetical protein
MAIKTKIENHSNAGVTIQLHLIGVVIFSLSLLLASGLLTYGFFKVHENGRREGSSANPHTFTNTFGIVETEMTNIPPWGQLTVRDIDLEQPDEYIAYEIDTNRVETWTFEGMNPDAARTVMRSCCLTAEQIKSAFSPTSMIYANSNTIITPGKDLVLSLSPKVRGKLYSILGRSGANELMHFPCCFPGDSFESRVDKTRISPTTLALIRTMLYPRGDAQCFSDMETLLPLIPDKTERFQALKVLSHRSAVLLGVRIWPDTDVDKIIHYWVSPGVREVDVRSFLESLKRESNGGAASILYLLPPFARVRLYTYPLPAQPEDPAMDCHWTTMNFFNATPDNRFSNPQYTVAYLLSHCYKIAKPSAYGDLIFFLNKDGNAIHSAVYLADDIVFTKNGNNAAQPWMLMHMKDLLAEFTTDSAPQVVVYRNKDK